MSNKITWEVVYEDFKKHFKHRKAYYWRPYDYATILLHLDLGMKTLYNYDTKEITLLNERWMNSMAKN